MIHVLRLVARFKSLVDRDTFTTRTSDVVHGEAFEAFTYRPASHDFLSMVTGSEKVLACPQVLLA